MFLKTNLLSQFFCPSSLDSICQCTYELVVQLVRRMELFLLVLHMEVVKCCNLLNVRREGYRAQKVTSLLKTVTQEYINSVDTFTTTTDPLLCSFESSVRVTRAQEKKIIKFVRTISHE